MDRERLRAFNAYTFAGGDHEPKAAGQILSRVRELPSMIQTNGLLATWAFYLANGDKNGYEPVAESLLIHLRAAGVVPEADQRLDVRGIFAERWLSPPEEGGLSGLELRSLTEESIRYAVWLKRAGEALLSGVEDSAEGAS